MDDQGFEELMEKAREVSRGGVARGPAEDTHKRVIEFARGAGFESRFVGYETTETETVVGATEQANGRVRQARGEPLLPGGRRPGLRLGDRRDAERQGEGDRRLSPG